VTTSSHYRSGLLILILSILCTGCLPSSCRRIEPQAISPSDSLSRSIAANIIADTLSDPLILRETELKYPRTILFGPDNHLYVSDTETGRIFGFSSGATMSQSYQLPNIRFPYLAGWISDTLVVFDPDAHEFHFVVDSISVSTIRIEQVPLHSLQYVLAHESHLYHKAVTRDSIHILQVVDYSGKQINEAILYGSSWAHAGLLRHHNDQLVSLSGFYPWALTWSKDLIHGPDTLRWMGFDSPMLRRTYAFDQGGGRGAPLITSSSVPVDDLWFVLNQRTGWIRIDVYDLNGHIQNILVEAAKHYHRQFNPTDLAVQLDEHGVYHIAVALIGSDPSIRIYHWNPTHSS